MLQRSGRQVLKQEVTYTVRTRAILVLPATNDVGDFGRVISIELRFLRKILRKSKKR